MKPKTLGRVAPTTPPAARWNVDNLPIFLTVEETADLLRKTPSAVYTMIERGHLPGVFKLRGRILVRTAVLLDSLTPEVSAIAGGGE